MSICENIIKVGSNIRKFRELKAISQKDFAIAIDMPISTLANYENNHRTPPIYILSEIAAALGVSVNDLLDHQELSLGSRIAECRKQKGLTEVINNIEKLILKEGYSDNLVYQKGKLDGLRLAINLLNKESEEK